MVSAYKTISMLDVVFQPRADFPVGDVMEHDMVCHVSEGELQAKQGDMEFSAKAGEFGAAAGPARRREPRTREAELPSCR
jgi:hypothetical protein